MTQDSWERRVVALIAESVRHHRTERGMSAQKLSQACAALGYEIPRSVIANLESGRRETLSVAEVRVLAAALGIPALLLEFPLGRVEELEVLPGRSVTPWEALVWVESGADTGGQPRRRGGDAADIVWLFREHQALVDRWEQLVRGLQAAGAEADGTADWELVTGTTDDGQLIGEPPDRDEARLRVQQLQSARKLCEERLKIRRIMIRHLDLTPPALPDRLRFLHEEPEL